MSPFLLQSERFQVVISLFSIELWQPGEANWVRWRDGGRRP
jgi:hypothetical protein